MDKVKVTVYALLLILTIIAFGSTWMNILMVIEFKIKKNTPNLYYSGNVKKIVAFIT